LKLYYIWTELKNNTAGTSLQIFAYAMLSAGSAAAAVANLNRTGIQHTALPNFCKPLPRFCDLSAASISCAFVTSSLLATSAVIDVIWLSNL
jgi:hypothetical protein